jgi:hypothetical protein
MEYRRNFSKYAAHHAQKAKKQLDERLAGLATSLEGTYEEMRRRLPGFFNRSCKPGPDE